MASAAKSSRSRPTGHSGVFPVNAAAGVGGSDGGVQLADKLKIFKTDNFDPDAYVQSKCRAMDEKVRNSSAPGSLPQVVAEGSRLLSLGSAKGTGFRGSRRVLSSLVRIWSDYD
jgi:hypothetical protein